MTKSSVEGTTPHPSKPSPSSSSSSSSSSSFWHFFDQKPKTQSAFRVVQDDQGKTRSYVGPYELTTKVLGHGGNSIVNLGILHKQAKQVAIKTINVSPVKMKAMGKAENLEEVKVMKKLIYPGVCRLFDVFVGETCVYLVMEFVDGQELFDLVRAEKVLSEPRALQIFSQLVTAVGYLHSMGMVHNDLKLENVLIDKDDEVTLIDFGHASSGETPSFKPGIPTLDYVAPEVVIYGKTSEASDVWSLGVVLYIMVVGYFPFIGSQDELRKSIVHTRPKFPKEVSRECKDLIKRMLTKDPKDRITLEELKRHPWFLKSLDYYDFDSYNSISSQ